ncbi:MAG: hypothetical protein E7302_05945 [Butyrivibrio sp.]|nr:hypothetical protein [Butyrivibrio sp.]
MDTRICKHCLLRDLGGDQAEMIKKYKDAIDEADRVSTEKYEERLKICTECDKLLQGTCNACGCYVELRALGKEIHCPKKKW